jgi:serine/threonine protein kinase
MQGKSYHYNLTTTLAKKYSHSTYLASSLEESEQQVVVITFSPSLCSSLHKRKAFLQKAQRLKELQHSHILPLLDAGIEGGRPFVVRNYLPNGSLRSYLKQHSPKQLEPSEALNIILQVGEALTCAHQQNIFHGNLKPENILFDANGKALLTDFTLVSSADVMVRDQISQEYGFCCMAPEQLSGTWDARSDQYAIGYLTYELLTGQGPFATQTLTTMMGNQTHEPLPLPEEVANRFPTLNAALLKTLAKEPNERFFDFSLFLEVIRSILSLQPAPTLLGSTTSHNWNATSHSAHPSKPYATSSSSRSVASPCPKPKTSQESASSNAEQDLAEPVIASTEFSVHTPEAANPFYDLCYHPLADLSSTHFSLEQEKNESSTNHQEKTDEIEVKDIILPLSNLNERDISLKRHKKRNRRETLWLVLFGFLIVTFAITAWNYKTAFLPVKKNAHDMLVYQKLTQATVQSLVLRTNPTAATKKIEPTCMALFTSPRVFNTSGNRCNASNTGTTPAQVPSNSIPPTIQPTMPSPSATSTSYHPTSSSSSNPTPTPTPTPTPIPQTTTIDDSVVGTGLNQFNYAGNGWGHCTNGCGGNPPDAYDGSNSWDNTAGDYVTISFTGIQIKFYDVEGSGNGIAAISLDGGNEMMVDSYRAQEAGDQLLWTSPTLPAGTHTFKLRVTGNKDANSTNTYIIVDRVDILS